MGRNVCTPNYQPPEARRYRQAMSQITGVDLKINDISTSVLLTYRMPSPRKVPSFSHALAVTHTTYIAPWISTQRQIARKSVRLSKSSNTFAFVQWTWRTNDIASTNGRKTWTNVSPSTSTGQKLQIRGRGRINAARPNSRGHTRRRNSPQITSDSKSHAETSHRHMQGKWRRGSPTKGNVNSRGNSTAEVRQPVKAPSKNRLWLAISRIIKWPSKCKHISPPRRPQRQAVMSLLCLLSRLQQASVPGLPKEMFKVHKGSTTSPPFAARGHRLQRLYVSRTYVKWLKLNCY